MIERREVFPHYARMQWLKVSVALVMSALGAAAADRVVINEVHFDPKANAPLEFVELHNPGDRPVDLTGWKFEKFRFPEGTSIAPAGFLVVAENPEAFQKAYGKPALGPLAGKLSNDGEKLTLSDARGRTVEQFKYGVGFPWPTATAGDGPSLERARLDLDASEPGAWRAAGFGGETAEPAVIVPAGSTWRWRNGDKEASEPRDAWRATAFAEGAEWQTGKAGFGYGDGDDATDLTGMQGRFNSVFLRHAFTTPAKKPGTLLLRVRVDDGCIVWLNGKEVARLHVPGGEPTVATLAEDHEATDWEEVVIPNAGALLAAEKNVLAVQVFNSARDSSDLSFDLALQTMAGRQARKRPSPGEANGASSVNAPACRSVQHFPMTPHPGDRVTITADFARGAGATTATLQLQHVEPGAYIRKSDPEYAQRWTDVPMRDDGQEGDARAGDQTWTAILPAEQQTNRRLVRYRIVAKNAAGDSVRLPYQDDDVPNFAYYVWAGPPAWTGAVRPGKSESITFSSEFLRAMPTFTLIANADDVARSQWDGGYNHRKLPGTLVYDGQVYDHMEFKNRGSASTYVTGKNKWGFHFPKSREIAMRDPWGRLYAKKWNSFAMNACASPWVQINRGMAGLDEAVSFRCYQLAGVPSSDTVPIHFRVVAKPEEQGKPQYEGDLWGLYLIVEDVDGAFLDNHEWPDGIIASHEKGIKRDPGEPGLDARKTWSDFASGPKGDAEQWWRKNMDLQSYYSFHAINRLIGNVDLRHGANHHFYRHPETGWMPVPWDLDMQFIPRHHQAGIIDQTRCLEIPALKLEYQNRAREILDLLASDANPHGGQIGQVIAEHARRIEPSGPGKPDRSWAMLDACMWDQHPRSNTRGTFNVPKTSQDMFGGPFSRALASPDFSGFCRYAAEYCTDSRPQKNYAPNDGNWLGYGWGYVMNDAKDEKIPARPTIRYTGAEGYPKGGLTFAISPFSDPQGTQTFAAVQWRLASIGQTRTGPWNYEIQPDWLGPESPAQVAETHIPFDCQRGTTYRVRARYKDDTGRWSHWSEPVEWVAK